MCSFRVFNRFHPLLLESSFFNDSTHARVSSNSVPNQSGMKRVSLYSRLYKNLRYVFTREMVVKTISGVSKALKKAFVLMAPPDTAKPSDYLTTLKHMSVLGKGVRPYYSPNETRVMDPLVSKVMGEVNPRLLKQTLSYEMTTATMRRIFASICRYDREDILEENLNAESVSFADSILYSSMSVIPEKRRVFDIRCQEMMNNISYDSFCGLPHDKTTSPGLPGLERGSRTKLEDLSMSANEAYSSYTSCSYPIYDWVVYAKAKENPVDKLEKGIRTIVATPYPSFLLGLCYSTPYNEYMNDNNQTLPTGVGSSWFHKGAEKLCDFFETNPDDPGVFDEADISAWDKLPSFLQSKICEFRISQINWSLIDNADTWKHIMRQRYADIAFPVFRMPDGTRIKSNGGQCSGHESTSHDNSLMHLWLQAYCFHRSMTSVTDRQARRLRRAYGDADLSSLFTKMKMKLYGDDSLVKKPTEISRIYTLRKFCAYAGECGFEAKLNKCKRTNRLSQSTYLSRQVKNLEGVIVPWRPAVNTAIRLLFGSYTGSYSGDLSEAYGRYIGHYIDNFFNREIRDLIEKIVSQLPPDIEPSFGKPHTYRLRDLFRALGGAFPKTFPTREFVATLYGVPSFVSHANKRSSDTIFDDLNAIALKPLFSDLCVTKRSIRHPYLWAKVDRMMFENSYYRKAHDNLKAKYMTSPFRREAYIGGHAGLKYTECFKTLGIPHTSIGVIDYGCHPGSGLNAILRWFSSDTPVFGVSLKPPQDLHKPFCYKLRNARRVTLYEMDVSKCTIISSYFDVACCDVTSVSLVQEDAHTLAILPVLEGMLLARHVRYCIFKMRGIISSFSLQMMYQFFLSAEKFILLKPRYSYAWSSETYVCVKRTKGSYIINSHISFDEFCERVYAFMNRQAVLRAIGYSTLLQNSKGQRANPCQLDKDKQQSLLHSVGYFDADYLFD